MKKRVMKRLLTCLCSVAVFVVASALVLAADKNLEAMPVENWSFEEPLEGTIIPGWRDRQGGIPPEQYGVTAKQAYVGEHSLRLTGRDYENAMWIRTWIPIPSGEESAYRVSAYAYVTDSVTGLSRPELQIGMRDADNKPIQFSRLGESQLRDRTVVRPSGTPGQWDEVVLEVVAPPEATRIYVAFYIPRTFESEVYWDQVSVSRIITE